ncbi:MAG: DUF1559 domain-containing protein [Fibrella sp.]|nr:DUF1559 domain-containing protein [Armatimonadota bacterium]
MKHNKGVFVRAFTLTELLVVVGIIGLLLAILLPVFLGTREQGRRTSCVSNLRQIGVALTAYTQDNAGFFPPQSTAAEGWPGTKDWTGIIASYAPAKALFRCPSAQVPEVAESTGHSRGYAINSALYDSSIEDDPALSEERVRFPAVTVSVCEFAYRTGSQSGSISHPIALSAPDDGRDLEPKQQFIGVAGALRHDGGSNFAFVDGHVHWYPPSQVSGQVYGAKKVNDGQRPSFAAL